MKRVKYHNKGFTLLELLIVILVLGVLAGLALPQYLSTVTRARETEGIQNLGIIRGAVMRYYAEWEDLTGVDTTTLDITDPNVIGDRYFDYTIVDGGGGGAFTVEADPAAAPGNCTACSSFTMDEGGVLTST